MLQEDLISSIKLTDSSSRFMRVQSTARRVETMKPAKQKTTMKMMEDISAAREETVAPSRPNEAALSTHRRPRKRFLCKLSHNSDGATHQAADRPFARPRRREGVIALFILLFHIDCCHYYHYLSCLGGGGGGGGHLQSVVGAMQLDEQAAAGYPPRITIHPNNLIAVEGESTELNCDAEGEPQPQIEWYHNGQLIKASSQSRTTMGGSIQFLDIRSSSPSNSSSSQLPSASAQTVGGDAGIYHCLARNSLGQERSKNASLQVACKYTTTPTRTIKTNCCLFVWPAGDSL